MADKDAPQPPAAVARLIEAVGGREKLSPEAVAAMSPGAEPPAASAPLRPAPVGREESPGGRVPASSGDPGERNHGGRGRPEDRKSAFSSMNGWLARNNPKKHKEYTSKCLTDVERCPGRSQSLRLCGISVLSALGALQRPCRRRAPGQEAVAVPLGSGSGCWRTARMDQGCGVLLAEGSGLLTHALRN